MSPDAKSDPLVEDAVAASLLGRAGDTRAARAFRELRLLSPGVPLAARLADILRLRPLPPAVRAAVADARTVLRRAAQAGITPIVFGAPSYPARLATIVDPPIVLWSAGRPDVFDGDAVAVVGSRRAGVAGVALTRALARDLAAAGVAVVSGLARGIDAAAHTGALDGAGTTIAVVGCGVDVVYPREHRTLAARIRANGCIVSELPPGTPPKPHHFPLRNRIISGLTAAVVVVEAAERSGSLITARAALDQGRDVLAVPGPVVSGCHKGCHALIKDGAGLVETADDVLAALGWSRGSVIRPIVERAGVAGCMRVGEPVTADELAVSECRSVAAILAELGRLEVAGVVARTADGRFVRLD